MRRIWIPLAFLSLLLLACPLAPEPAVTVPPPTPWTGQETATFEPTATAVPETATVPPVAAQTETPVPTPTWTLVPPPAYTPTPQPPGSGFSIHQELGVAGYTVRIWRDASDDYPYGSIATISRGGLDVVRIDNGASLNPLTGTDITGEGNPDVVIETYSGGAHCCFETIVYDMGTTPAVVLHTPASNCGGEFQDLDGDGVLEYLTCDDLFAYAYCAFAGSPMVRVVLQYAPGGGYLPASPRFAYLYDGDIATHVEQAQGDEPYGWDDTNKCEVLPLVMDYLYTDRPQAAWDAFRQYYRGPDALVFWSEVVRAVSESPLYAPGTQPVPDPAPPYYMLQLLTSCGPEWKYIGLLGPDQPPCDLPVPRRDLYWFAEQLRRIGLLSEGEDMALAPEGCTTECRLDVVRRADGRRLGSIRVNTQIGFPGAVYRVNGWESDWWRMRGDMAWERVPR